MNNSLVLLIHFRNCYLWPLIGYRVVISGAVFSSSKRSQGLYLFIVLRVPRTIIDAVTVVPIQDVGKIIGATTLRHFAYANELGRWNDDVQINDFFSNVASWKLEVRAFFRGRDIVQFLGYRKVMDYNSWRVERASLEHLSWYYARFHVWKFFHVSNRWISNVE